MSILRRNKAFWLADDIIQECRRLQEEIFLAARAAAIPQGTITSTMSMRREPQFVFYGKIG